jgi:hypothetical protein
MEKFARVGRLVNPLTMDGQNPPYVPVSQPCSHYLAETAISQLEHASAQKNFPRSHPPAVRVWIDMGIGSRAVLGLSDLI